MLSLSVFPSVITLNDFHCIKHSKLYSIGWTFVTPASETTRFPVSADCPKSDTSYSATLPTKNSSLRKTRKAAESSQTEACMPCVRSRAIRTSANSKIWFWRERESRRRVSSGCSRAWRGWRRSTFEARLWPGIALSLCWDWDRVAKWSSTRVTLSFLVPEGTLWCRSNCIIFLL